ncbi:SMC-Scp complex subunit ScpB [Synechococcales cyanobacterium C]|uniref:SMC-Scp complex subunit ScpB n=1 Tax=Petrachloros mirabilis ULC683 TaxID=2781853 RepID=A0A8K2A7S8_9CYAN|nr:SMC-Scp complex subunit ScpB [Petrachloros mirabilis ULC683]
MISSDDRATASQLATQIEAILYLKAQPLTIAEIAEYAGCDRDAVEDALIDLMQDFAHRDSALEIVETDQGYSLQLRETYQDLVQKLIPLDLGLGALRTLAVIALKGPIAQTDLVDLRGSGAYQHVSELAEQGFIRKRRLTSGRSYQVQVTNQFYQYFQIDQLPGLEQLTLRLKAKEARQVSQADETEEATPVGMEDESESGSAFEQPMGIECRPDQPQFRIENDGDAQGGQ